MFMLIAIPLVLVGLFLLWLIVAHYYDSRREKEASEAYRLARAADRQANNYYSEAEKRYKRQLAFEEEVLGPGHRDVAKTIHSLAECYVAQGKHAEAEPLYERERVILKSELAIRRKDREPKHPLVAQSSENFADRLRNAGLREEADEMEARAKAIRAKHAEQNPTK